MSDTTPSMIPRFVTSVYAPDDTTYDIIYTDRLTGQVVLSYDGADPANTSAAYGAITDEECFEKKGLDINEEIEMSKSVIFVHPSEPEQHRLDKENKARQKAEEDASRDLFEFLGAVPEDFDHDKYVRGEREILKPALEARGFTGVSFYMGEVDSFGPLSRIVYAIDPDGVSVRFYYC